MLKIIDNRYQVKYELGSGGMGTVYLAYDPRIKRTIAIKTLKMELIDISEIKKSEDRFYREAQTAGNLNHPNIVNIYDIGKDPMGKFLYIAMEYIEGRDLNNILKSGYSLNLNDKISMLEQTACALDYAHAKGVIHRDIKPANIMIADGNMVKLTDFGLAKIKDSSLTQTGEMLGTVIYMSPEQFMGKDITPMSDIFSLGITAFQLLTGQLPFYGNSFSEIMYKILQEQPQIPSYSILSSNSPCAGVIYKCLDKNPQNRHNSAGEFVKALRSTLSNQLLSSPIDQGMKNNISNKAPYYSADNNPYITAINNPEFINVDNKFYICDHPVTQEEYQRIMGNNPSHFQGTPNNPVEDVSWYDAVKYCNERSKKEGLEPVYNINGTNVTWYESRIGYRLPTEAEWEYAAKGGSKSRGYTYSGSNNIDEVAWYGYEKSGETTHPVKGKKANELGLYDMSGNVLEWCWDWYPGYEGSYRVFRGGSWFLSAENCTVSSRYYGPPDYRFRNAGFRVAVSQVRK